MCNREVCDRHGSVSGGLASSSSGLPYLGAGIEFKVVSVRQNRARSSGVERASIGGVVAELEDVSHKRNWYKT